MTEIVTCPRAPITRRHKTGKRIKLAITVDEVLYNKLMTLYQEGYAVSHVIDSALWVYFDRPALSFQIGSDDEVFANED